ncbi:hypothetical protein [Bythopirellula polymerisocia]|uniref:Uncharacterized protein n=1 Tax=Bythopirellula polymerisocia TaxID=2528003 RepID=A0A5C6CH86_9BACT|nr:hypothetical protein [Bythopirellula polymerisocia]TWU23552.1 hypothetical protein Pla144_37270 [Bythopirellula polymerisocia]
MPKQTGMKRLMAASGLIGFAWLLLLPWIAEQPGMKSHLDWLEAQQINPSAMYYTELDVMEKFHQQRRKISH